jgi:hypothetical protein
MDDAIQQVAAGDAVTWEMRFKHPTYGELTARVANMPTYGKWLQHGNMTDLLIREFGGNPDVSSSGTHMLAAAVAGFRTIFEPIPIAERRTEDPETGSEHIEKDFYDPLQDEDPSVALEVWVTFWAWREALLSKVDDVGKSSGETTGDGSDVSSPAGTVSPSTTHA